MKQFLAKLFITLFVSSIVTACSPPDDPAADAFDLVKAEILWNIINKSWSNNELRSLESGRAIYKINCAACHGKGGEGNLAIGAPSLINNAIIRGSHRQPYRINKKWKKPDARILASVEY